MSDKIKIKKSIITWIAILLILGLIIFFGLKESSTVEEIPANENPEIKSPVLYFYDNKTNCSLNGEIYSGERFVGEVINGKIELNLEDYKKIDPNETFYVLGDTDSCFGKNSGLPFYRAWTFIDWEYLFETGESENFILDLNPRWPIFHEEMQMFVKPYETQDYLESNIKKYLNGNTEDDLDKINEYSIRYRDDSLLFNEAEYWQTPAETLKMGHGDCEDWAVTTLSIMREYNSSITCYNALWDTHLSIMCFLDNKLIIYDQDNIKFSKSLQLGGLTEPEKKVTIRKIIYQYLDYYGLGTEENTLHALFNEKQLIEFKDTEDFIDWILDR